MVLEIVLLLIGFILIIKASDIIRNRTYEAFFPLIFTFKCIKIIEKNTIHQCPNTIAKIVKHTNEIICFIVPIITTFL